MIKISSVLVAGLLFSVLNTSGCDDKTKEAQKPEAASPIDKAVEKAPRPPETIIMGYGRDWSPLDCGSFPGFELPPQTRICGVIGKGQGDGSGLEIVLNRREAFNRARLATVEVNSPDAPVVLLISSQHSTLWRIIGTPGTEVTAAAISGHNSQAIMGLKPETPVMINDEYGYRRCGQFYQDGAGQRRGLSAFSEKVLGRTPDVIAEPDGEGRAVCGWPASPGQELISHGELRPEKYDAYAALMAKLDEAETSGTIRRAVPADMKQFKKARSLDGRLLIEERGSEILRDAYVVESSSFVFPDELYHSGDHSPHRIFTFFIPQDLSLPEGPIEGARILFLEDGGCLGWNCGYRQGVYSASPAALKFRAPDLKLPQNCRFDDLELPEGTRIYAGGAYKGRRTGEKDPKSKHDVGRIDVVVNSPEDPVVLILGAYDPVEWHLDIKPDTTIGAVVLGGYHTQKLINLPKGVPMVSGSYDEGQCWNFYFTRENFVKINHISENLFGRVPDRGFHASGGILIIDPSLPPREAPQEAYDRPQREEDDPGLKEALAKGLIRPASKEVKNAWFRRHAQNAEAANLMEPADYIYSTPFLGYEVLSEEFAFTKEMRLRSKQEFYLPENMNVPTGDPGSATIYLMDDGTCLGTLPGCRHYRY